MAPQTGSRGANANACRRGQGQRRNSSDAISSSHWTRDSRTDMSFCVHSSNHVLPPIPSLDMAHQRGICARVITCREILYNLIIATSFSESSFDFSLTQISKFFAQYTHWCIFRFTCSQPELTEDHVLTSAYVKSFRTVTRNAVNKSV